MKRYLYIILAFAVVFALCACGQGDTEATTTSVEATAPSVETSASTEPSTTEPTHQHQYSEATCTSPATCSCGATEGEALGHSWLDATCDSPKTCSTCGITEGEVLAHSWVAATCTTRKQCTACGITEGYTLGHSWVDATCASPKKCATCGTTQGQALAHSWTDADCTTPKTCSACGATEGEALGHAWADADCATPKTCSTCGATEGDALDHNYVDGTCACGETNYIDPRTVNLLDTEWYGKYYEHWWDGDCDEGGEKIEPILANLCIPYIWLTDWGEESGDPLSILIGDKYYITGLDGNTYDEYLNYTIYNGERWDYQSTGVGMGYTYELTENKILVYCPWYDPETDEQGREVVLEYMLLKDGTMVCVWGRNGDIDGYTDYSGEIGQIYSTDMDAICGLEIIIEPNPDYVDPDAEPEVEPEE